ncbi:MULTISPECIES: hypothetical protein [Microcoleaceae]|uniref:hypothetical protein n=1 Tax=Microcoleaceae TaxID=1892252 RepID=UPI002FCFE2C9
MSAIFLIAAPYNIRLADTGSYTLNAQVQCGRISSFTYQHLRVFGPGCQVHSGKASIRHPTRLLLVRLAVSRLLFHEAAILQASWCLHCEKAAAADLIFSSYSIAHPLELYIGKYAHIGKIYERERLQHPCHPFGQRIASGRVSSGGIDQ